MLANTINVLNEKGVKYKVSQEGASIVMAFGIVAKGTKTKIDVVPAEADILVRGIGSEKSFVEEDFGVFLDNVVELRACQERESKILEILQG